jgi:glycosyltransferase involved in cell wall biosynthesis
MSMNILGLLAVTLPAFPLAFTVVNLLTWRSPPKVPVISWVSALVPARDEEQTIGDCVRALQAEPFAEILVYDDGSTDRTAEIVLELARHDPRIELIRGEPLPAGWVGKVHACHQLARRATSEKLLFVDADVRLLPGATGALDAVGADLVTALPLHEIGTVGEGMVMPLLHLSYVSWLPMVLVRAMPDPRVLAANGQLVLVTRRALDAVGGFERIRGAIVDDMALGRVMKEAGLEVAFVPGDQLAVCRMYRSGGEAWRGFSKNLYPGLGSIPLALFVAALYFGSFVLPWLVWPTAPGHAALGMGLNLLQRLLIGLRFGLPVWTVLMHLPSALAFLGILVNSWRWTRAGTLLWRGRAYAGGSS